MLGFLSQSQGYNQNQTSPLGAIGGFIDMLGIGRPKIKNTPTPAEQQAMSLLLALNDPNNSYVKEMSQKNLQMGMENFLKALKQKQVMDSRRMARGVRGTFFDPERADESMDYQISRFLPEMAMRAEESAKGDIRSQANSLRGFIEPQQSRMNVYNQSRLANYDAFGANLGAGITAFLQALQPKSNTLPWNRGTLPWL